MKKFSTISFLILISSPAGAFAQTWVDGIVQAAQDGKGVYTESHASASTGGQTAASGQSVTTGDVSASSQVETHINTNGSGGSVQVKVETSENGVTKTEEYAKDVAPGESVNVQIGTSSGSVKTQVGVRGWDPKKEASTTIPVTVVRTDATSSTIAKLHFNLNFPTFLKSFFSFFWRF